MNRMEVYERVSWSGGVCCSQCHIMRQRRRQVKSEQTDVQRVFREFADGTSMHGVPRIINARSVSARIFWSIICLAAFGMFTWQSAILLHRYYSYPKKVNVEIVQRPVPFPSVSVCNTDQMDLQVAWHIEQLMVSEPNVSSGDTPQYVLDVQEKYAEFWEYSTFFFHAYISSPELNFTRAKIREDMLEAYSRLGLTANVGPDIATKAGIKLEDFIVNCRFMDDDCNISKSFVKYFDPYYFNCFMFQPEAILPNRATRLQGVEYGLSLLLFTGSAGHVSVGQDTDYLVPGMQETDPALASGRGARVVVHSPDTMPHPTAEGFDVPPGFSVTIGVKARENARIHPPHGNCSDQSKTTVDVKRGVFKETLISCQNDCIQRTIMETCKCIDNRISMPENKEGLRFCFELPNMTMSCFDQSMMGVSISEDCVKQFISWSDEMECRKEVYENMTIKQPDAMDKCQCHPPCNDVVYDSSYSLSTLPERTGEHTSFYITIDQFFENLDPDKKRVLVSKYGSIYNTSLSAYIARLNVHIADGNIYKTTESPDYETIRLISDIGGQLGLWIGISVMTLFEVIQLVADVFRYLTGKSRNIGKLDGVVSSRYGNGERCRHRDSDIELRCEIDKLTTV